MTRKAMDPYKLTKARKEWIRQMIQPKIHLSRNQGPQLDRFWKIKIIQISDYHNIILQNIFI